MTNAWAGRPGTFDITRWRFNKLLLAGDRFKFSELLGYLLTCAIEVVHCEDATRTERATVGFTVSDAGAHVMVVALFDEHDEITADWCLLLPSDPREEYHEAAVEAAQAIVDELLLELPDGYLADPAAALARPEASVVTPLRRT